MKGGFASILFFSIFRSIIHSQEAMPEPSSSDFILGTYSWHHLRTMEFGGDGNGNCIAYNLNIPKLSAEKIKILPGNQVIRYGFGNNSRGFWDPLANEGSYFVAIGKWTLKKDTLSIEFLNEVVYRDESMNTIVENYDMVALDSINQRIWTSSQPQRFISFAFSSDTSFCWLNPNKEIVFCYMTNNPPPDVMNIQRIPDNYNIIKKTKVPKRHGKKV